MPTETEKLIRDINGLKESVRLAWLEMASRSMTSAERQELRKHIDLLDKELKHLRAKLDEAPKAEV
jgi:hypothetical protein